VHAKNPDLATKKAKDLVRMAVARAGTLKVLHERVIPITKRALVVGGGIAGMNAARGLSRQGFEVVLVEKENELGGMSRKLHHTIEGGDIPKYLEKLIKEVHSDKKIDVFNDTRITGYSGYKGNFKTTVETGADGKITEIEHGVIIIATGAKEYEPTEYPYHDNERVVTQVELGDILE